MPPKRNPFASPSEKTMGLMSIFLFTQRPHSLTQLAAILQCSKQSVLRMFEQIQKSDWVTVDSWITKKQRWYQTRIVKRPTNVVLDSTAIEKLLLCKDMVWHLLPDAYRKEITAALKNAAEQTFAEPQIVPDSFTQVKPKGYIDYSSREQFISDLIRAIRENRICEISYKSPSRKAAKSYQVAGYQMVVFREGLYLRCRPVAELASEKPEDIILSVHRMHSVSLTDQFFEAIAPQDSAEDIAGTFGLRQGEAFRATVKVAATAAMYVQERVWSSDQKIKNHADGSLTLHFSTTSEEETIAWVLSFGGAMELVEPAALRKKIADAAKAMATAHK